MMRTANRVLVTGLGILASVAGLADELESMDTSATVLPATIILTTSLSSESLWQSSYMLSEPDYTSPSADSQFDVEFKDSNTLKQLSKLRNLSLMTLSEKWNSQVFLGVNEDGLVGLHFTWLPRQNKDHILELAKLPHLREEETPAVVESAGSKSR